MEREFYMEDEDDLIEQELERAVQEEMERLQKQQQPSSTTTQPPLTQAIPTAQISAQPQPQPVVVLQAQKKGNELCVFAISGKCRFGTTCRNVHGLQCPRCLLYCLHPTDLDRNEAHINECLMSNTAPRMLTAEDEDRECGICYEPVRQKGDPRFGLLACEHVFCLQCIRTWRSKQSATTAENLRSCPMCRTVSYFVTPSTEWVGDGERKARVIEEYKRNLGQIPCSHFNYGEGQCPFGTSCFYEHKYRDGREAEAERIRAYVDSNEQVKAVRETRLSDFVQFTLSTPKNKKQNQQNKK